MQVAYEEIGKAVLQVLAGHGLAAASVQLMPVEPPREWGVTTNACFSLAPRMAAEEIAFRTEGLSKKEAKQLGSQITREVANKLAAELAAELNEKAGTEALPYIARVEAEGAYVNFYYDSDSLTAYVVGKIDSAPFADEGRGKREEGTDMGSRGLQSPDIGSSADVSSASDGGEAQGRGDESDNARGLRTSDFGPSPGDAETSSPDTTEAKAATSVSPDTTEAVAATSVSPDSAGTTGQEEHARPVGQASLPATLLADPNTFGHGTPTGKRIMVEYAQPNTHKDFHVGHLRNASIGQAIANLLEFEGNDVLKATYIGDMGLHVAKAIWGSNNSVLAAYYWFTDVKAITYASLRMLRGYLDGEQDLPKKGTEERKSIDYLISNIKLSAECFEIAASNYPPNYNSLPENGIFPKLRLPTDLLGVLRQWGFKNPVLTPEAMKGISEIMSRSPMDYWSVLYKLSNHLLQITDEFETFLKTLYSNNKTVAEIVHIPSLLASAGKFRQTLYNSAYQWLKLWEIRDPTAYLDWLISRDQCLKGLDEVFKELSISFQDDCWFYESRVDDTKLGQKTAEELKQLSIAEVDESPEYKGALYVDFEKQADAVRADGTPVFRDDEKKRIRKLGKMVILRSDGTSLYQTKELGLAKYKFDLVREKYGSDLDESLYVVGSEQKLYFEQVFAILRLWGFPNAENCRHISYELVILPEGKMSSREGTIVSYRELRDEAIRRAEVIAREKGIGAADEAGRIDDKKVKAIARDVAIAAIKYAMLKVSGSQQIVFNFEEALSFTGRSAPYLQYAYARAGKLVDEEGVAPDFSPVTNDEQEEVGGLKSPATHLPGYTFHPSEIALARLLSAFPSVCRTAAANFEPAGLCTYLYDLATAFSEFYRDCRVLDAPQPERSFRQDLTSAFRRVLRTGFSLLALPLPEEM